MPQRFAEVCHRHDLQPRKVAEFARLLPAYAWWAGRDQPIKQEVAGKLLDAVNTLAQTTYNLSDVTWIFLEEQTTLRPHLSRDTHSRS